VRHACLAVHAVDIPVLDLDTDPDAAKRITAACRNAVEVDGCDAIVLGCAGMTALCASISAEIGVPVVDGARAATLQAQSLVTMGLRTGDQDEFAAPVPKTYAGLLRDFGA
jgi:allantoin racemase